MDKWKYLAIMVAIISFGCSLINIYPTPSAKGTSAPTNTTIEPMATIEAPATEEALSTEIPAVSLSEVLPEGLTYEVIDEQSAVIPSGDPVQDDRIFLLEHPGTSFHLIRTNNGYVERAKKLRISNGVDKVYVTVFSIKYFFKDGSSASVTYSATETIIATRTFYREIKPGVKTNLSLFSPAEGSSFTPEARELFAQGYHVSGFEADLLMGDQFEFLRPAEVIKALDNVRNKGELDLSFRVVVETPAQIPE